MAPSTVAEYAPSIMHDNKPSSKFQRPAVSRIVPVVPRKFDKPSAPKQTDPETPSEPDTTTGAPDSAVEVGGAGANNLEPHHLHQTTSPPTPTSTTLTASSDSETFDQSVSEVNGSQEAAITEATTTEGTEDQDSEGDNSPAEDTISLKETPTVGKAVLQQPDPAYRRELPPPFYPSENPPTPVSAISSTQPPVVFTPDSAMYRHRPRSNSIVFGGYPDSSNSSPGPPMSGAAGHFIPEYSQPSNVNGYGSTSLSQDQHVHAHQPSDPSQMMYAPMVMTHPNGYGYMTDHRSHDSYGRPPPEYFMSSQEPNYPVIGPTPWMAPPYPLHSNGHHESHSSHESSPTREAAPPVHEQFTSEHSRHVSVQSNGFASTSRHPRSSPGTEAESMAQLQGYLLSQYGNPEFTDYILQVWNEHNGETGETNLVALFNIHGIIVSRSPAIHRLIAKNGSSVPLPLRLDADKYATAEAYDEILRYLYGAPLLDAFAMKQDLPPVKGDEQPPIVGKISIANMKHVISYMTAAVNLELHEVYLRGMNVLAELLRWDNVEYALNFALDRAPEELWTAPNGEGSRDTPARSRHTSGANFVPTLIVARDDALAAAINFIVSAFPRSFVLDTRAPQLPNISRLPSMPADRKSFTADPRLSRIQFGEVEAEKKDWIHALLSSILLSVPHFTLSRIFQSNYLGGRIGWPQVTEIMRSVVMERELRRTNVFKGRGSTAAVERAEETGFYNCLLMEESIEESNHPCGYSLRSVYTPLSQNSPETVDSLLEIENGRVKY